MGRGYHPPARRRNSCAAIGRAARSGRGGRGGRGGGGVVRPDGAGRGRGGGAEQLAEPGAAFGLGQGGDLRGVEGEHGHGVAAAVDHREVTVPALQGAVRNHFAGHRQPDDLVGLGLGARPDEQRVGLALRAASCGLGLSVGAGDVLLGLGANLPHAILSLDGVLRGLHGAVDGPHHVFGQPQGGVERELVDDEAVGLELLANLTLRRGEQARLARAVDLLHGHLRRGLIDGLAHDVAYIPVRQDVEVGLTEARVELRHLGGVDVKREAHVGVDAHALARREGDGLVAVRPLRGLPRPHHILNARRKHHDALGDGVEGHPARHDGRALHAAVAAREAHANAHVPHVDAGAARRPDDAGHHQHHQRHHRALHKRRNPALPKLHLSCGHRCGPPLATGPRAQAPRLTRCGRRCTTRAPRVRPPSPRRARRPPRNAHRCAR